LNRRKARILAINQVTGPLFKELLADLTLAGIDVLLLSGWVDVAEGESLPFRHLPACPLTKTPAWRRIWTWCRFSWQALMALGRHRNRLGLLVSNPPLVPWLGPIASWLFGVKYTLLVYDVYPDVLARMGMIRTGKLIERVLRCLSRRSLLGAQSVITIGRRMEQLLKGHLHPSDDVFIEVIENWADTHFIVPLAKQDNPFARQHGLVEKFAVIYSGAFGATHDVETIVQAADLCRDLPEVRFILIGSGTRQEQVEDLASRKALSNLELLPFQPLEQIRYTLTAADCLVVTLGALYEGVSVPSKTYYALAAGTAIIGVCGPETELAEIISRHECGLVCPPGDPAALAKAVRRLHGDPMLCQSMGRNARHAAETDFNRQRQTGRYCQLLRGILNRSR